MDASTVILDNGAHSIKLNHHHSADQPHVFSNAISNKINSKIKVPFERGILTNWDIQTTIWDTVFENKSLNITPSSTNLVITEPTFNLPNVQSAYDQILFEEYNFNSVLRCPGASFMPYSPSISTEGSGPECVLVIDSGYSFTHIVPIIRGSIISSGIVRIDIGGKLLTNHLKELVSFRQWYMMDQTQVIERVKETCCYVTNEWSKDWDIANSSKTNSIVRTYVLPDFVPTSANKLGYLRPLPTTGSTPPPSPPLFDDDAMRVARRSLPIRDEEEQLLQMSNERFTVPELLFNPSCIGLNQAGIHEAIAQSISALPVDLRAMFWSNIICVGGNCAIPGFERRLATELRQLCPIDYVVHITIPSDATLATVIAASDALDANPEFGASFVSRSEYQESGVNASRRKMEGKIYWSDAKLSEEIS